MNVLHMLEVLLPGILAGLDTLPGRREFLGNSEKRNKFLYSSFERFAMA